MDTTISKHNSTSRFFYLGLLLLQILLLSLVACNLQSNNDAPVSNGWEDTSHAESTYRVGQDETLYSIAWRYGLDFRQLVAINHFQPPYHIKEGQIIKIIPDNTDVTSSSYESIATTTEDETPPVQMVYNKNTYQPTTMVAPTAIPISEQQQSKQLNNVDASGFKTVTATTSTATLTTEQTGTPLESDYSNRPVNGWLWPVRGKVIDNYTGSTGFNKGIDIAGHLGEPIHATASGKVVYCGNGLRGYGQLIIIKHNDEYLSAYAHNSKLLVHEGQIVNAGQVIALMGNSEAQRVMLHFEIRRAGKPVDPLTYLSNS
jgi:lipoprotein NlpD